MDGPATMSPTPLLTRHVLRAIDSISETSPADPERDVHCALLDRSSRAAVRAQYSAMRANAIFRVMTVPGFFWIGLIVTIALMVSGVLARSLGLVPAILAAVLLGSLVIPAAIWLNRRGAPRAPKEAKALVARASDERFRLRLISDARCAWALRGLSNQPFEPRVFPILFYVPVPRWVVFTCWILCMVTISFGWMWLKRHLKLSQFMLPGLAQPWEIWAIMAVISTPFAWAWPAYLRVSPGKADVIRYPLLGMGKPSVVSFDVRRARVVCQAHRDNGFILFEVPGQPPKSVQLNCFGARFHEVFRAVFEAARWRGDLLTLPDDELTG